MKPQSWRAKVLKHRMPQHLSFAAAQQITLSFQRFLRGGIAREEGGCWFRRADRSLHGTSGSSAKKHHRQRGHAEDRDQARYDDRQ